MKITRVIDRTKLREYYRNLTRVDFILPINFPENSWEMLSTDKFKVRDRDIVRSKNLQHFESVSVESLEPIDLWEVEFERVNVPYREGWKTVGGAIPMMIFRGGKD